MKANKLKETVTRKQKNGRKKRSSFIKEWIEKES